MTETIEARQESISSRELSPSTYAATAQEPLREASALKSIAVKIDPNYPHFGLVGEPTPHKQHQNQQAGLDLYVSVINLDTGEPCFKKLYENKTGLHFKHTGYSPMYLSDFTVGATFYPFQVVRGAARSALMGEG